MNADDHSRPQSNPPERVGALLPSVPEAPCTEPVSANLPLDVKALRAIAVSEAKRAWRRTRGVVELEELVGAGNLAVAQVLRAPTQSADGFFAYARQRVRGAIIDYVRKADPLSRAERRKRQRLAEARAKLEGSLKRVPRPSEVVRAADMDPAEYEATRLAGERALDIQVIDTIPPGPSDPYRALIATDLDSPETTIDLLRQLQALEQCQAEMPERTQDILRWYFHEERTLVAIAQELSISESRVSQILKSSLMKLREAVKKRTR